MYMFKKIVSVLLILSFLVFSCNYIFAANDNSSAGHVIKFNKNDSYTQELSVIDNDTYFFEDTDEYTITIVLSKDNRLEIALIKKDTPNRLLTYNEDLKKLNLLGTNSDNFLKIKEMSLNGKLEFEIQEVTNTQYKEDGPDITPFSASRVTSFLHSEYGKPYSDTLLGTKTRNSATARLYGSRSYTTPNRQSRFLTPALKTIAQIAVLSGFSPLTVTLVARVILVNGVKYVAEKQYLDRYTCKQMNTKTVYVNSLYQYYSGSDTTFTVIVGEKGEATEKSSTHGHSDFNNNSLLLDIGLDNYFGI